MDLRFTAEEIAFRDEVREFFRTKLPEDVRRKGLLGQRYSRDDIVRCTRILHEKGWAVPTWPVEWGGTGWDAVRQYIFKEELFLAGAPELLAFNINMIGPTLIAFGTEAQKKHFLPKIANLDLWFCQGFSEPGAGSDLAALRTSARREGDHYVVNGQKIWTTLGHHADWCFMLVRTDSSGKKQEGITYLLMDMKTPGVTLRPLHLFDGHHEFNEMFLEDVRIPVENLVGEENKGWDCAKYLLSHERGGVARTGLTKSRVALAKERARSIMVDGRPLAEDQSFRERLAAIEVELKALEMMQMRVIDAISKTPPGTIDPKNSILKILGSDVQQMTTELMCLVAGYDALEYDDEVLRGEKAAEGGEEWPLTALPNHYWLRHTSISGGTNEVQRNILAKSVLGL